MKKRGKNKSVALLVFLIILLIILAGVLIAVSKIDTTKKPSKTSATYEIGTDSSKITAEMFFKSKDEAKDAVLNLDNVDFNKTGNYKADLTVKNKKYEIAIGIVDTKAPEIALGNDTLEIMVNSSINTSMVNATVNDLSEYKTGFLDLNSDNAEDMKETLDFDKEGDYEIYFAAVDNAGNLSKVSMKVKVTSSIDYLNKGATNVIKPGTDFSEYSNKYIPYGNGTEVDDKNRPTGCGYYNSKYGQYTADYIQPYSQYVFLTFDEGYENGNTPKILDVLKEKNAKAVFFVTLPFAKENPDLVQRMIDEGHVIGNHTATHPSAGLCSLPVSDQINEIEQVHKYILDNFNYEMYLFRFPTGAFSEQSLAIVQSLGYRAVFWSFAHHDWDVNNQPDVKESLDKAIKSLHGGEIFLLHGISTTDTNMLGDLIDGIRAAGYEPGYYYRMDY